MATGDPMCPHCGAYLFGSGHLCGAMPSIYKSPLEGWQSSNPNDPINLNRALVDALACADRLRAELRTLLTRHEAMRAALEKGARVAYQEAERIKHTSHADGLGMGSQCCEATALRIAAVLRALLGDEKENT